MAKVDSYVRHKVYLDTLDTELWVAEDAEGRLYFPVRPSCVALDIDPATALDTIRADSRLAPGLFAIRLPTPGGDQSLQCLHSTEYAWWLALIDPRNYKTERRPLLEKRQRILMQLAEEIMLKRRDLRMLTNRKVACQQDVAKQGPLDGDFCCLRCGAPHHLCIDGAGWHITLGNEVE